MDSSEPMESFATCNSPGEIMDAISRKFLDVTRDEPQVVEVDVTMDPADGTPLVRDLRVQCFGPRRHKRRSNPQEIAIQRYGSEMHTFERAHQDTEATSICTTSNTIPYDGTKKKIKERLEPDIVTLGGLLDSDKWSERDIKKNEDPDIVTLGGFMDDSEWEGENKTSKGQRKQGGHLGAVPGNHRSKKE